MNKRLISHNLFRGSIVLIALASFAAGARAEIHTETIEYKQGDTVLEGYLAFDPAVAGKRPGVLVVHDWMGQGPFSKSRAEALAKLGYVAFAADIYGKGVHPANPKEAGETASKYKSDRKLMRERVQAALDVLKGQTNVDPTRIGAIGYCFGGTCVLELARSGADVAGVVTFHGGLDTPTPEDAKQIKGKVLVLHGADDPFVKPSDVAAFEDEMRKAAVDWQIVFYANAVHSFTNPAAGTDNSKGAAYNAKADARSWEAMKTFFNEIFPEKK